MEDIIEKVLKYTMMITSIAANVYRIIKDLRTNRHKPKH